MKTASKPHPLTPIRFNANRGLEFEKTLKKRVRQYFKDNGISRSGNSTMIIKAVVMMTVYFTPYFLMVLGIVTNPWLITLCWIVMGFGIGGIGMGIMHDANHGSFSKNEMVNRLVGKVISLIGGYSANWKIQHNVLHHSYTNVTGYDEDIDSPAPFLRFSPLTKRRKVHEYQHLFAWFFYGFLTLSWMLTKDFKQLFRYKKMGLTKIENEEFWRLLTELIIFKVLYYGYIFAIPLIFMDTPWWGVLLGILLMHFVAGIILSVVFQLAHVVPDTVFPAIDDTHSVDNNWAVHQMQTTANFAPNNGLLSWMIGGLNYQIEHHLFPNICHVHYRKISEIVKKTANEFGIPYHSEPTLISAIASHGRMLKQLGRV